MKLRRWALLVGVLYLLTLVLLAWPALWLAFLGEESPAAAQVFSEPVFWALLIPLGMLQSVFLLARIEVHPQRPIKRRRWTSLAWTAGALMGLLCLGLAATILELITAEGTPEEWRGWVVLGCFAAGWVFWAILFGKYARANPNSALRGIVDRLLKGSIAELLIAVPAHIYARHQTYCCAGMSTFIGLATGLAVLLFALGPGVLLLFAARVRRLRKAQSRVEAVAVTESTGLAADSKDALLFGGVAFVFASVLFFEPFSVSDPYQTNALEWIGGASVIVCGLAAWWHAGRALARQQIGGAGAAAVLVVLSQVLFFWALVRYF